MYMYVLLQCTRKYTCWELENRNFCLEQNWESCSIQFSLHLHVVWLPWLGFHENTCNFFSIFTAAPISLTSDCDDFESHDAYSSLNYPRNYQREWKITVSSGMVRIGYRLSEHMGKVIGWHWGYTAHVFSFTPNLSFFILDQNSYTNG